MVTPTVVEDTEMPGGRALITPAKKKEARGKEEGRICLFSEFYTPLLHYLTLKLSYSEGIFLFLIQVWPLRFSRLFESCHMCFLSIYYTYSFFFFPTQFSYLQTESFKMFSSLPPPQLWVSSLNPKEALPALPQGFTLYLIVSQYSLCCLQLLPINCHMLMSVTHWK